MKMKMSCGNFQIVNKKSDLMGIMPLKSEFIEITSLKSTKELGWIYLPTFIVISSLVTQIIRKYLLREKGFHAFKDGNF